VLDLLVQDRDKCSSVLNLGVLRNSWNFLINQANISLSRSILLHRVNDSWGDGVKSNVIRWEVKVFFYNKSPYSAHVYKRTKNGSPLVNLQNASVSIFLALTLSQNVKTVKILAFYKTYLFIGN
jgi:hypothetical protein